MTMTLRNWKSLLLVSALPGLGLGACSSPDSGSDDRACTSLYAYGATVQVTDALSGAAITNAQVSAISLDGEESAPFESWTETEPGTFVGLGEAPGNWTLTITASGYITKALTLTLESDGCHVIGQSVEVALTPGI